MGGSSRSYSTIKSPSAYSIHDGRGIRHQHTTEEDLLGGPSTYVELSDLAPGRCSAPHVAIIQAATCVGPTALALPYVFLLGGFLLTFVLLPIFAFVASLAFGPKGAIMSALLQFTVSGGLIATYLAILFQDLPVLLAQALDLQIDSDDSSRYPTAAWFLKDRVRFAEIVTAVVILFCLGWSSHTKLKRSCMVLALALFVACFFVLVNAPALHKRAVPLFSKGVSDDYLTMHVAVCHSMAILATSFASPHHIFHTFYALRERSIGRFAKLSIISTLISIFWALGFGVGGYYSFLSDTKPDVLQNYVSMSSKSSWAYWILIPFCAIVCIALEVRHFSNILFQTRDTIYGLCCRLPYLVTLLCSVGEPISRWIWRRRISSFGPRYHHLNANMALKQILASTGSPLSAQFLSFSRSPKQPFSHSIRSQKQ